MYQLNSILSEYFIERRRKTDYNKFYIYTNYEKIVGKSISKNTKINNISNGIIYIYCRNSIWVNELTVLKDNLIKKVNDKIYPNKIKDMVFKIGNVKSKTELVKKNIKLNQTDVDWVEKTAENIPDTLKEKFKELLTTYKQRKKI
jgi:hypothetical protein